MKWMKTNFNLVEWNGIEIDWFAAAFIEEFHSSNYGVVGYVFLAHQTQVQFSFHSTLNQSISLLFSYS